MKEIVQMLDEIQIQAEELGPDSLGTRLTRGKSIRGISGKVESMDLRSSLPSSAIY